MVFVFILRKQSHRFLFFIDVRTFYVLKQIFIYLIFIDFYMIFLSLSLFQIWTVQRVGWIDFVDMALSHSLTSRSLLLFNSLQTSSYFGVTMINYHSRSSLVVNNSFFLCFWFSFLTHSINWRVGGGWRQLSAFL